MLSRSPTLMCCISYNPTPGILYQACFNDSALLFPPKTKDLFKARQKTLTVTKQIYEVVSQEQVLLPDVGIAEVKLDVEKEMVRHYAGCQGECC